MITIIRSFDWLHKYVLRFSNSFSFGTHQGSNSWGTKQAASQQEAGLLSCLYMPRASRNDTCPVFLRRGQSIPTETSVYLAIKPPEEVATGCDNVCAGRSSMPLAMVLKYPLQFFLCSQLRSLSNSIRRKWEKKYVADPYWRFLFEEVEIYDSKYTFYVSHVFSMVRGIWTRSDHM